MTILLSALGLLAALGVVAFFHWERHDMAKAYIHSDLVRHRASEIQITSDWMDFDHDTLTYDVVYTDVEGRRQHNRCKIATGFGSDSTVYWSSPLG